MNVCRIARNVRVHVQVPAIECSVRMPNAIISLWNHMRPFWFYLFKWMFLPARRLKWHLCNASMDGQSNGQVTRVRQLNWRHQFRYSYSRIEWWLINWPIWSRFASRLTSNFALRTWHSVYEVRSARCDRWMAVHFYSITAIDSSDWFWVKTLKHT